MHVCFRRKLEHASMASARLHGVCMHTWRTHGQSRVFMCPDLGPDQSPPLLMPFTLAMRVRCHSAIHGSGSDVGSWSTLVTSVVTLLVAPNAGSHRGGPPCPQVTPLVTLMVTPLIAPNAGSHRVGPPCPQVTSLVTLVVTLMISPNAGSHRGGPPCSRTTRGRDSERGLPHAA